MIASCGEPGPPAAFVPARIALSTNRRDPAIRFGAPTRTLPNSAGVYPPDKDFPLAAARERQLRFARFVADSSAWPRSERGVKQGPAQAGVCGTGRNPPKPAGDRRPLREPVPHAGVRNGDDCMSRTGKRRSDGKAAWELRKLRAETEIAERQLAEMSMRRLLDIVKVSVTIVGVIIAMIVMFQTIGLLS